MKEPEPHDKLLQNELKSSGTLPEHIAVIMDGNGRWAKSRGLPRVAGHSEGINSVKDIVEACGQLGIGHLTLYTFSLENWQRPKREVSALMKLLFRTIRRELKDLMDNEVRISTLGNLDDLPSAAANEMRIAIEDTSANKGLKLHLALSYGSRREIIGAVKKIVEAVESDELDISDLDEKKFSDFLLTNDTPDPDLLIRTSGEARISNFLLWQLAYTELYITDTLWPEFRRAQLYEALSDYQRRERRYGKVSEQIN
ncbi:MAG: isoprenyl transferase [Candidatus Marinimicrobia bacterium]|nr:isoprenyl transferase [Candidatus Neomarinimicrobiota bacterium]MCH7954632.1 isoprenyl transferase [Candidatus Neomarinimicrobiota bacterium]